jgi:hypothetical protein
MPKNFSINSMGHSIAKSCQRRNSSIGSPFGSDNQGCRDSLSPHILLFSQPKSGHSILIDDNTGMFLLLSEIVKSQWNCSIIIPRSHLQQVPPKQSILTPMSSSHHGRLAHIKGKIV